MVHKEIKCEMESIANHFSTMKFISVTPETSAATSHSCQWPGGMDLSLMKDKELSLNEGK